jgi:hypothetical protein
MGTEIRAKIGLDSTDFEAGISRVMSSLGNLTPALAGIGTIGGITMLSNSVMEFARNIEVASEATGITTEALQRLDGAGEAVGVSTEKVNSALEKLFVSFGKAEEGDKKLEEAFRNLGISAEDIANGGALVKLAEDLGNAADRAKTLADIQEVLGKQYRQILPMLTDADRLKSNMANTPIVSNEDLKRLHEADMFFSRWGHRFEIGAADVLGSIGSEKDYLWEKTFGMSPAEKAAQNPDFYLRPEQSNAAYLAGIGVGPGIGPARPQPENTPEQRREALRMAEENTRAQNEATRTKVHNEELRIAAALKQRRESLELAERNTREANAITRDQVDVEKAIYEKSLARFHHEERTEDRHMRFTDRMLEVGATILGGGGHGMIPTMSHYGLGMKKDAHITAQAVHITAQSLHIVPNAQGSFSY